ncbi:hypothetical protein [Nonomuraea sp. NPDC050202]|uniref:hypothetical protein n=1 Tax=Nonomuraea sp. NPDC050202 TaxID=3155035 RepID=UPI0033F8C1BB
MDEQRKAADRMSAPGHLTAEAGRDQGAMLADQVNRMIALAEEARSEETWAFDALSRFVAGCAGLGLDPLAAVEGAGGRDAGGGGAAAHAAVSDGLTRDAAADERGPGTTAGKRTPGTTSGERTPGTTSGERTPGTTAGERTPDTAAGERTPDAAAGPESGATRDRLLKVLDDIVRAGHDEGALRADVGVGDVVGVVGLLVRGLPTVPAGLGEELRERAARLVLAGMRAHPAPTPPGAALTAEELARHVSG